MSETRSYEFLEMQREQQVISHLEYVMAALNKSLGVPKEILMGESDET